MAVVKRAYKYRFYPTADQVNLLNRTFGCVRYVYNRALDARTRAWYERQERISYYDSSKWLTQWKQEPDSVWLSEVSNVPLQQTLQDLQAAFSSFWSKRSRYPRFKSKSKSKASARFLYTAFSWRSGQLTLAKMHTPLKIVWDRSLPNGSSPTSVTVSKDSVNRWFVSFLVDEDIAVLPRNNSPVGLDLGLSSLVTLSTGEKVVNPRYEKKDRTDLRKAQKALSRKQKGSANREKARLRLARIHARVADRRRDHLHKLTTRLIRENQVVVVEDLPVRNMIKNRSLARSISDASWSELRRQLEYKADWYGRDFIAIDRWYPSSKVCSSCKKQKSSLTLKEREWDCEYCSVKHDRDVNAAKNIRAAGLAVLACGDGVRPKRQKSQRQLSVKQEA